MAVKTMIAEDDNFSMKYLRNILLKHKDFEIISEATTGKQLLRQAMELQPDAIFVDIDLPVIDGMSVVRQLNQKFPNLIVVFVTAHADFAVDAFELSSLDYIVKPFDSNRVEKALIKIRERINEHKQDLSKIAKLLKNPEKLYIKTGHEIQFIDADTIYFVERKDRKTIIHTTARKYETTESIVEIESRVNPDCFFRAHKSYLINLRMIEKMGTLGSSFIVKFKGYNLDALMTRQKAHILYELMNIFNPPF